MGNKSLQLFRTLHTFFWHFLSTAVVMYATYYCLYYEQTTNNLMRQKLNKTSLSTHYTLHINYHTRLQCCHQLHQQYHITNTIHNCTHFIQAGFVGSHLRCFPTRCAAPWRWRWRSCPRPRCRLKRSHGRRRRHCMCRCPCVCGVELFVWDVTTRWDVTMILSG